MWRAAITPLALMAVAIAAAVEAPAAEAAPAASRPIGAVGAVGAVPDTVDVYAGNTATPARTTVYGAHSGNVGVAVYDAAHVRLLIDEYQSATGAKVGKTRSIAFGGWPEWGGFFAAADGYFYVLVGRDNPHMASNYPVIAVRRYTSAWAAAGVAYIRGGATQGLPGIVEPFAGGAAHVALVGDRLVVHTSRLINSSTSSGQHHQANFTFEVDTRTMTARPFADLGGYSYSSHSFQQLVAMNGRDLVMIDHGDAYPRAVQMGVMAGYPDQRVVQEYNLLAFPGAIGDNYTGAAITALVSGKSGIGVLGTSVRTGGSTLAPKATTRNAFLITATPATGKHRLQWLTGYAPASQVEVTSPKAVQVGPDLFAVLYQVRGRATGGYITEYRLINSAGTMLAVRRIAGVSAAITSEPVLIGTTIYWVGQPVAQRGGVSGQGYLFGLDVSRASAPKLVPGARMR
jgi:hypothetical protein